MEIVEADIVDRLKARHQAVRERGGDMMTYGEGDLLAMDAAQEIEELREALRLSGAMLMRAVAEIQAQTPNGETVDG